MWASDNNKEKKMKELYSSPAATIITILGGRNVGTSTFVVKELIPDFRRANSGPKAKIMLFTSCPADKELYSEEKIVIQEEESDKKVLNVIIESQTKDKTPLLLVFEKSNRNHIYNSVKFSVIHPKTLRTQHQYDLYPRR